MNCYLFAVNRALKSTWTDFDNGFETIVSNISEVFFLLDRSQHFMYLNPKALRFFGIQDEDTSHITLWHVFPFEKGSKLAEFLTFSILENKSITDQLYSTSHSRWFKIATYPTETSIAVLIADANEDKVAYEKLKKNEANFRLVLDFIPHIAFILKSGMEVSFLNQRWTEYTGRTLEAGLGTKWAEMIHPDDYAAKRKLWDEKSQSGDPFETEFRVRNASGEYRWHSDRIIPIPARNGTITMWVGTATEIHETKLNKETLEKAEMMTNSGHYECNLHSGKITFSPGAFRLFGYPPNSFEPTLKFLNFVSHPEDPPKINDVINQAIATSVSFEYIRRIYLPNRQLRHILTKGTVIYNSEQKAEKIFEIIHDISDKIAAGEALRQQHHFVRQIAEATPDLITVIEIDSFRITYANIEVSTFVGYSAEELKKLDYFDIKNLIHPDDWQNFKDFFNGFRSAQDKEIREIEYRGKDAGGELKWFKVRSKVFERNQEGLPTHFISITQDITAKKLAEKELKKNEHFIKEVTEASPDLIFVVDLTLEKISYVNHSFYPDLGWSIDLTELSLNDVKQKIYHEDLPAFEKFHSELKYISDEDVKEIEYRLQNRQNRWKWLRERGKVFQRDDKGNVTQFIINIQEITEKKEVLEKQKENEVLSKLVEKKDEFMSIASHELKTPITTLKASIQVMKRLIERHTDENTLLVFVSKATQQVNKLTSLISDLMDNAKIQAGKLNMNISAFSMHELIMETVAHHSNLHNITVNNNLDELVEGDKVRIEQVITNFLSNAIKYSPKNKEVRVDVKRENRFIKVSVTDFGIGIPEEKLSHVFDRFFRVEEKSQEFSGLGLGLYISAEIVKRHKGEYGVNSQLGKGSTFWFKIPLKQAFSIKEE
nr:PAS domain-containing protein [Pedobacter xinjiangensis]